MPIRTSPATTSTAPRSSTGRRAVGSRTPVSPLAPAGPADPTLDEALERISELAARLWAVRSAHRPVTGGWRRSSTRCAPGARSG